MSIPSESRHEINRVKRDMFGCGKGDLNRSITRKYVLQYPECKVEDCLKLRKKGSDFCNDHSK